MIALLEKAFEEVAKLPEDQQETIARWILDELADEERWDAAFADTSNELSKLASKALTDFRAGRTDELDPDSLE